MRFPYSSCSTMKMETVSSPGVFYHKGYANLQILEEDQGACEKTFLVLGIQRAIDLGRYILLIIHTTFWDKGNQERKTFAFKSIARQSNLLLVSCPSHVLCTALQEASIKPRIMTFTKCEVPVPASPSAAGVTSLCETQPKPCSCKQARAKQARVFGGVSMWSLGSCSALAFLPSCVSLGCF